jgi:large repetitive protein
LDPVNPTGGPLATPPQIPFPALDPATTNSTTRIDETQFIASADFVPMAPDFVSLPGRVNLSDPFAGRIDLTFNVGLPGGHYVFIGA